MKNTLVKHIKNLLHRFPHWCVKTSKQYDFTHNGRSGWSPPPLSPWRTGNVKKTVEEHRVVRKVPNRLGLLASSNMLEHSACHATCECTCTYISRQSPLTRTGSIRLNAKVLTKIGVASPHADLCFLEFTFCNLLLVIHLLLRHFVNANCRYCTVNCWFTTPFLYGDTVTVPLILKHSGKAGLVLVL